MSNSQKYINIISILNIIGGAAQIIIGLLGAFGVGSVGADAIAQQAGDASAHTAVTGFIIALIVAGVFSLICGILGVRAAKDASKIKPVFVLACISLAVALVGNIASIIGGSFSIGNLTELVAPALMVFCANNVRKQNG